MKQKKLIEEVNDSYMKNCKAKELLEMEYSDPNKLNNNGRNKRLRRRLDTIE